MSAWPRESHELCQQITRNTHDRFGLSDSDVLHDPLTDEEATVESLLAQLTDQLTDRDARPFTFQRLKEMAKMGPEVSKQYAENHGAAYIRALLQLSNVSSSSAVFDNFDHYLEQKMPEEIRLEPIVWASIEVPQFSGLSGADISDSRDDHELASPPKKPKLLKDDESSTRRDEKQPQEEESKESSKSSNEEGDSRPEEENQDSKAAAEEEN